jgi:hypothetical protein
MKSVQTQMVNGSEVDFGDFADGSDADADADADADRKVIFGGLSDQEDCSMAVEINSGADADQGYDRRKELSYSETVARVLGKRMF